MDKEFEILQATRRNVLSVLNACTVEQLFIIPTPFNNNIIWNAAHLLATQQVLWYRFTDTPLRLDKSFVDGYSKGTVPTADVNLELVDFVKKELLPTVDQSREDYHNGIFGPYKPVTTSYGVKLESLEDAISYLNLHEGMHFGQIKMLQRLV